MPFLQPSLSTSRCVGSISHLIPSSGCQRKCPHPSRCFYISFYTRLSNSPLLPSNFNYRPAVEFSIWILNGHFECICTTCFDFPCPQACPLLSLENGTMIHPDFQAKTLGIFLDLLSFFHITSDPSAKPTRSIVRISPE